jgi:hypothetical protein
MGRIRRNWHRKRFLPKGVDPSAHVIAGDIVSPAMTESRHGARFSTGWASLQD